MKLNSYCFIIGAALVLTVGCKKAQNPSDVLAPTKNAVPGSSVTGFPLNSPSQRLIAFDNGDGTGLTKLLSYDNVNNTVDLINVSGGTLTNVFTETVGGFKLDNGATLSVAQGGTTDDFNEVGNAHVTAFDGAGNGHLSYLMVYVPGQGKAAILTTTGTAGVWHMVWPVNGGSAYSTSGFEGYDLKGTTDKVLAYGVSGSNKSDLIIYRPGNGIFWVFQNQGGAASFNAVVKSSSGVSSYDLKGTNDQISVVDNPLATGFEFDLLAYRPDPGLGYCYYIQHKPNTSTFTTEFASHSGLLTMNLLGEQDRIIAYDENSSGLQNLLLGYIPGNGPSTEVTFGFSSGGNTPSGGSALSPNFDYPLGRNPYAFSAPFEGDKLLPIHGNAGLSTLVCYQNGTGVAQIWEQTTPGSEGPSGINYTQIY